MLSFKDETLLFIETLTRLRSKDVMHREPTSFWRIINVLKSIIIHILKNNTLRFDSTT